MDIQDDGLLSPEQLFDHFLYTESTFEESLNQFQRIKNELCLNDVENHKFFSELKKHFTSWRVTSFLEILQLRARVKEFSSSVKLCKDTNIFVIGAGPCGLRFAIDAALCGASVVVVEKRGSFTRNNVLHLWPYLIHDLRALGAKKLYGKFCAGSLDHISIRRLQLILIKICLVLGVQVHCNTGYVEYLEPANSRGWRVITEPVIPSIDEVDFDVLVGADGKRNSIKGFQRKEFRAKLAIGITANFVNFNTEDEAKIEEISGVAALFNQKFFADLKIETDIDLENIVYYKDDTHYFVMTAKKASLLKKGVLIKDSSDVISLLSYNNVDKEQLKVFVREASEFACGLPHDQLATNPDTGEEDVAIFDFTSMYSAEHAAKIYSKHGHSLIVGLVGDGLMEPFWPLGTGCARGFLSCMDLMWMVRRQREGVSSEDILKERMALYQLLHQTSNENMQKKHSTYTIDPKSRYKIIPSYTESVDHLIHTDTENIVQNEQIIEKDKIKKRKLAGETTETIHKNWKRNTYARTRKPKNAINDLFVKDSPTTNGSTEPSQHDLLKWCQEQLAPLFHGLILTDLQDCWKDGVALCGLVYLCAPNKIDLAVVRTNSPVKNVNLALGVMLNEFGIQPLAADDILHGVDVLAVMQCVIELRKLYEELQAELPNLRRDTPEHKTVKMDVDPTPDDAPAAPIAGAFKKRISQRKVRKKTESKFIAQVDTELAGEKKEASVTSKGNQNCYTCNARVMLLERVSVEGYVFHRQCFRCNKCRVQLKITTYTLVNDKADRGTFYCKKHFNEIVNKPASPAKPTAPPTRPDTSSESEKQRPHSMMERTTVTTRVVHRPKTPVIKEESAAPAARFDDPALRIHSEKTPQLPIPAPTPRTKSPVRAAVTVSHTTDKHKVQLTSPRLDKRRSPISPNNDSDSTPCNSPTPAKPLRASQKGKAPAPPSIQKTPSFDHCPQEHMPLPVKNARVISDLDTSNVTTRKKSKKQSSPNLRKKDKVKHIYTSSSPKPKRSFFKKTKTPKSYNKDSGSSVGINSCEDDFSMTDDTSTASNITSTSSSMSRGALVSKSAIDLTVFPPTTPPPTTPPPTTSIASGVKGRPVNSAVHGARITSRPPPTGLNARNVQVMFPQASNDKPAIPRFGQHNRVGSMDDMDKYLKNKQRDLGEETPMSVKDRIAMYKDKDEQSKESPTKRKLTVNTRLSKSIEQETKRLNTQRPISRVDADSKAPRKVLRKKSVRARMSGSKQEKRRLEKAQQIQRDKSMLEEQMYEFEMRGATIERKLRDDPNNNTLLGQFLELVNVKNELMRKENELLICEKYLQLLDEQEQLDRDLRYSLSLNRVKSKAELEEEERMILKKFDVVNKRDCLLMQLDEDKRREQEEDDQIEAMLSSKGMMRNTLGIAPMTSIYSLTAVLQNTSNSDDEVDGSYEDELTMLEEASPSLTDQTAKLNLSDDDSFFSFKKLKSIFS